MPDPMHPECPYDPGDAGISRPIRVDTVTIHRTIGTWQGDYSVGKHRSHNDGTFQFLIGQDDGQWVQFYPANAFCSHGYCANLAGPGIEISGQNGEPLTDWQIEALGKIVRWFRDEWGVLSTFTSGSPRRLYDNLGPSGFITHDNIFSDIPKYTHFDYILDTEFWLAMNGAPPPPPLEALLKPALVNDQGIFGGPEAVWVYDRNNNTATWVPGPDALKAIQADWAIAGGDPNVYPNGALIKAAYKFNMPV